MHARSALFDLYGDYLRPRGDRAPVAALVRMLSPLGITPPAVRTAVSRMVRQGWLEPASLRGGAGYALTDRARHRLDEAGARIYGRRELRWDGCWDLLVLEPVAERSARRRLHSGLGFLGYVRLSDSTWISPAPSPEVPELLQGESATARRFRASGTDARALAEHAWDLPGLASAYLDWREHAGRLVSRPESVLEVLPAGEDERAFAVRFHLVHEWRKFLFRDPGLPPELLPPQWPGTTAARFFTEEAARLLPASSRFVDDCLLRADDTSSRQ